MMRKRVSGSCTLGNKFRSFVAPVGPFSDRGMSAFKGFGNFRLQPSPKFVFDMNWTEGEVESGAAKA
jgi:hypothetical protein